MPTPNSYYRLHAEYEALKALAFRLLVSDEVPSLNGPNAAALFDVAGDMSEDGSAAALRELEATRTA
ncbi:MAG: hypothetical protein V7786_02085 [Sulfitobacter litoralis]|uniref:hypothetical protein n=1 Tax=Sulfitobacter litoralis TaxID=335975 RepID=UPI003002F138